MAITLQDLIDKFNLSKKDQLDVEFRNEHLVKAAWIIQDYDVLGQQLGLSNHMATINLETDPQSKGLALLKIWKKRSAWLATYCKLIEALLECGRADCARDVCVELLAQGGPNASAGHSAALTSSLPSKHCAISSGVTQLDGQLGELSPDPTFPTHNVLRKEQPSRHIVNAPEADLGSPCAKGEATSEFQEYLKKIERMFEDLVIAASKHLKKEKVPVFEIKIRLLTPRATDTQTDFDLVARSHHDIQQAVAVDDLFQTLTVKKCWDFLNPGLLKRIIDDHCSESQGIQDQKQEYLKELQKFKRTTTPRQLATVCCVGPKFSEVVFKMGIDWDNDTLEYVQNLQQEMHGEKFFLDSCIKEKIQ